MPADVARGDHEREPRPFARASSRSSRSRSSRSSGVAHHARLVDEQQARLAHERLRERGARLVGRRELVGGRARAVAAPTRSIVSCAFACAVTSGRPSASSGSATWSSTGLPRAMRQFLRREADGAQAAGALGARERGERHAVEPHGAGVGRLDPGGDAQQRGLAAAAPAEDRDELARPHLERDGVEHGHRRLAADAMVPAHALEREHGRLVQRFSPDLHTTALSPHPAPFSCSGAGPSPVGPEKCCCFLQSNEDVGRKATYCGVSRERGAFGTRDLNVPKADYRKS